MPDACAINGCGSPKLKRGWCSMHYQRWWKTGSTDEPRPTIEQCSVEQCANAPRSRTSPLCEMHYYRLRRTGSTDARTPVDHYETNRGYRVLLAPNHPLADNGGRVYEHRVVLFDEIGDGGHPCRWCGTTVEWGSTLHVDHLDHDRSHNDRSNLVPSCFTCNVRRTPATAETSLVG